MSALRRVSIHEQRGLTMSPRSDQFRFATSADRAFVESMDAKVRVHALSVGQTSPYMSIDKVLDAQESLVEMLNYWLGEKIYAPSVLWDNNIRFLHSLGAALDDEVLVIGDAKDVESLRFLIGNCANFLPQVMEYYTQTGEIQELVGHFKRASEFRSTKTEEFSAYQDHARVKMYRLYCYDVNRVKNMLDAGDDPQEHMSLPLDIRMGFAGFFEQADEAWHLFTFDHQHLFDDTIFDQMKTMEAVTT